MFEEKKPVARIAIGWDGKSHDFRNIYDHHLKTFGVFEEDIPLLNMLHQDARICNSGKRGYLSITDEYKWILETHPFSCRNIDERKHRQWYDLTHHLYISGR
ncbi:MAG: hypothetical protein WA921_12095 [Ahrensia sp.]